MLKEGRVECERRGGREKKDIRERKNLGSRKGRKYIWEERGERESER